MTDLPVRVNGAYIGTLRILGTRGLVIGLHGKRLEIEPAAQAVMNRYASKFSRAIRDRN